jgi:C4-dicarboxylate transporter, DctM subunit
MLMINIVFIILGCLIDSGTLILILVPLLLPTIRSLGIDLVHFGVVVPNNANQAAGDAEADFV